MGFSLNFNSISFVLTLVALVFLILATISTPVVSVFKLGSTTSYDYGIFGYCKGSSCSSATYPYTPSSVDSSTSDWLLGDSTRDNLAKVFILCPIAAGFNLITLALIVVSHFVSSTLLLVALVLNVIVFLITTVVAILVILVFYPHVLWTAWILVGAAAADLLSIIFLLVAFKFKRDTENDVASELASVRNGGYEDLTKFDDKFSAPFAAPAFSSARNPDDTSSVSQDYEYKVSKPTYTAVSKTISNSSVYNSNPQLANDFTQKQGTSSNTLTGSNPQVNGSSAQLSGSSYYEDARMVNGPNTPVKQHMAPNVVPKVATPTRETPYPQVSPKYQNTGYNQNYNQTYNQYGVFEHHPEVEGHKPFTEMDQEEALHQRQRSLDMDSDNDSDFTSVSQRAPNPSYYPPQPPPHQQGYFPNQYQQQPQQGYVPVQQYQQQYTPQFSQYNQPVQQRGPTVTDSVLQNNPDFAVGGMAAKRKPMGPGARVGTSKFGGMPGVPPPGQRKPGNNPYSARDGPYGMLR